VGENPGKRPGGGPPPRIETNVPLDRAERVLVEEGIDPSKAKGFIDSGIGPRTVRTRVVGERFKRYSGASGDKGSFLTEGADYPNAKAAKDALDLRNPPTVIQEVEIIRDVRAVESGIKGGAQDARQLIVPPDSYRIVSERPIR
jgi:hypothetical protein